MKAHSKTKRCEGHESAQNRAPLIHHLRGAFARQEPQHAEAQGCSERDVPDYIDTDHTKMTAKFVRVPALSDVPYPVTMEPNLVVEFYSR